MWPLPSPWRDPNRLWRSACHVALTPAVGTATFTLTLALLATTLGLAVTFLLAIPVAWALFVTSRIEAALERSRIQALLGVAIADPVPPLRRSGFLSRLVERARTGARWREIAHHLLVFPLGLATGTVTGLAWSGSLALLALPLYVGSLPGGTAKFWLFEVGQGPASAGAVVLGVVGVAVVAPQVTLWSAELLCNEARALLGPTGDATLRAEVSRLEVSRSAAVDSAEDERRRIERDLHDGAQQRLVALAAGLGAARRKLAEDPEAAAPLVADAHEEAKAALAELRDLVRGIHPVILEDRGLDAALSAVAARCPVPVTLDVDLDGRPPPAVESAAYFVVSEALVNVAQHARASRARVEVAKRGRRLVVEVRDDGVGGADPDRGTGLHGLSDRVVALGGTLVVTSPPGGPTTLSVELPCGS